jgi:hypothetical protein
MTIPQLQNNDELPAGEHPASLDEVEMVYGSSTERRKELMKGLRSEPKGIIVVKLGEL